MQLTLSQHFNWDNAAAKLLLRVDVPFSFPRLCSMSWAAAIIWGILPTLLCCLGVNCSALCEWIFGKCPLMTMYVSPPALFTPHISYWIYWLFYRRGGQRVRFCGPSLLLKGQRKGQTTKRETLKWDRTRKGLIAVKIWIIATTVQTFAFLRVFFYMLALVFQQTDFICVAAGCFVKPWAVIAGISAVALFSLVFLPATLECMIWNVDLSASIVLCDSSCDWGGGFYRYHVDKYEKQIHSPSCNSFITHISSAKLNKVCDANFYLI